LVLGTASGALAWSLPSLVAARILAGLFGGPATSLSLSIIADVVPVQRRGHAMGMVMSAFSVASVLGVPMGLMLSRWGGWHVPFMAVAGLGVVVTVAAVAMLPPLTLHLEEARKRAESRVAPKARYLDLFGNPLVVMSLLMTAVVMMGGFILIPNISAYVQMNLGYPRDDLGLLYLAGGLTSFAALRVVGGWVDRFGAFRSGAFGALALAVVVFCGFVMVPPPVPVMVVFIGFMLANSFRNVAYNTLASRIPAPAERAQFMSIQSAVQHLSSALAAFLSSQMLDERDGRLWGMGRLAGVSIALSLLLPVLMWTVEGAVKRRDARRDAVLPGAQAAASL
jgi:predicted MFS family arabinose efflux permease